MPLRLLTPTVGVLLRWLLLPLLLVLALLLSAGRLGMAYLDNYRGELERLLAEAISYPVSIGAVEGGWHQLSPTLRARELRVGDAAAPLLRLRGLELELDLLATLQRGQPVLQRLVLEGPALTLQQDAAGQWRLAGQNSTAAPAAVPALGALLHTLWLQREVVIQHAELSLELAAQGGLLPLDELSLRWQRRGTRQRLHARLGVDAKNGLTLQGEASGEPGSAGFRARYFAETVWQDPEPWRALLRALPGAPQQLELNGRWWGRIDGDDHWLGGSLELARAEWSQGDHPHRLDGVAAQLQWRGGGSGRWQGQLDLEAGALDDAPLGVQHLNLAGEGAELLELGSRELDLAALWRRVQRLPLLEPALWQQLAPLNPHGVLRNLRLLRPRQGSWAQWRLDADLDRLAVGAWQGAPEVQGVSGRLQLDAQGGRVDLDSEQFWLNFPELYRQGWQFDRVNGVVSWRLREDALRVESQLLSLHGTEVSANGRFALELPRDAERVQEGRLILMVGMRDSNGALAPLFVPDRIIEPALFHWLEGALNEGHLRYGGLVYDAPLLRRDAATHAATLQMFFDAGATRLRYQPGWPAVQDADAFTLIKNSEVLVQVPRGRVYEQTRIDRAEVYLPPDSHTLEVRARLEGPAADGRLALLESPIGERLGEEFARWEVAGALQTELNLGINLDDVEHSRIRVNTKIKQGSYWSQALNLRIEDIAGAIHFDEQRGLYSDVLSATFFERPLVAQVETSGQGDAATTRIRGWGGISMAAVRQWTGLPLIDALQGESDYAFELRICGHSPGCSRLRLDSQLRGVSVTAPPPFAKPAKQQAPFRLELQLSPGYQWLQLQHPQLKALLALQAGELRGGELALGQVDAPLSQRTSGLVIQGVLDEVDLGSWRQFVEQRLLGGHSLSEQGGSADSPAAGAVTLQQLYLKAGQAEYQGVRLRQLDASLQRRAAGWQLSLRSDQAAGLIELPAEPQQPLRVALTHLRLPAAEAEEGGQEPAADESETPDPLAAYDPRGWPALDLSIDALQWGDADYGRWQFKLRPDAEGVSVNAIESQLRGLDLKGAIRWRFDGQQHHTHTTLNARAADLGAVMTAWGSARSMSTESARFDAQVDWAGTPARVDWASLNGSAEFEAKQGQIFDTGDRQVVKLFSLFNVTTLLRRLSLDFKDLTGDGTAFDRIHVPLRINQGVATTAAPATLVGPTYDLEITGDTDLAREQLDLSMLVQLPVAENLPIAAALLASPAVAGAVFLVERLIGKQLKRFTSVRYRVSGPWQEPQLSLRGKPASSPPVPSQPRGDAQ